MYTCICPSPPSSRSVQPGLGAALTMHGEGPVLQLPPSSTHFCQPRQALGTSLIACWVILVVLSSLTSETANMAVPNVLTNVIGSFKPPGASRKISRVSQAHFNITIESLRLVFCEWDNSVCEAPEQHGDTCQIYTERENPYTDPHKPKAGWTELVTILPTFCKDLLKEPTSLST